MPRNSILGANSAMIRNSIINAIMNAMIDDNIKDASIVQQIRDVEEMAGHSSKRMGGTEFFDEAMNDAIRVSDVAVMEATGDPDEAASDALDDKGWGDD